MIERDVQGQRLGPKLQRLRDFLAAGPQSVQNQPDGLEPERLLVFEVTGSVTDFAKAVNRIDGLMFAGEDLLDPDELDDDPQVYLLVPDRTALEQIVNLWQRWQRGMDLPKGFAPWRNLFLRLRDIRPWGPGDRVRPLDQSLLLEAVEDAGQDELIRLECELVFRTGADAAAIAQNVVAAAVMNAGGQVVSAARHSAFSYDAMLIDMPRDEVRRIAQLHAETLADLDPILSIMPQSMSTTVEEGETEAVTPDEMEAPLDEPVAAIFDAVPLQSHPWISDWLILSDPYDLQALSVGPRIHGTAMASVIVHGDRNINSQAIGRKLYFRSVMYAPAPNGFGVLPERFQDDRLIIDLMIEAVMTMRQEGFDDIVIVNISLGDANKKYGGRMSAWGRALDYLSYRYGLLFIVSSGNISSSLNLNGYVHPDDFNDANCDDKKSAVLSALDEVKADRRILAPAESINCLTVGAWHKDGMAEVQLPYGRFRPFPDCEMPNISSALGHGHKSGIKPDILLPGGREHIILSPAAPPASIRPQAQGTRFGGIRVASPPVVGQPQDQSTWIIGSSPAAAYATHTAHRLYEVLEREYGELFTDLPNQQKAVLLKALVAHPASWQGADKFITATKFPVPANWDQMRREVARHLGYGFVSPHDAVSCAGDRATLWASGRLGPQQAVEFSVPVPDDFSRSADTRSVKATLAWLSPTRPGHQAYRACKLRVIPLSDNSKHALGVSPIVEPPWTQTEAGTLIHRQWSGQAFGHMGAGGTISLQIQREKDQGPVLDDAIPFGLVVSVGMNEVAREN